MDRLADPARIVLCSTGRAGRAYFLSGGDISFSKYFWQGVANGVNLHHTFCHAANAISFSHRGQTPVFDDNGNGVGNEKSDGRWARRYTIGSGIMLAGDDPLIGSVCDAQTLTGETEATISVKEVTTTGEIVSVWAVITPPDYDLRYEAEELPVVQLTDDEGSGEYEVTYGSFDRYGTYEVAIYAKDDDGNLSLPQITHVQQDVGPACMKTMTRTRPRACSSWTTSRRCIRCMTSGTRTG